MTISMFEGKNGERLIVQEPFTPGEFAVVSVGSQTEGNVELNLTYQEAKSNGYPALSPETSVLRTIFPDIDKCLEAADTRVDEQILYWKAWERVAPSSSVIQEAGTARQILLAQNEIEKLRTAKNKPAICPGVRVGGELCVILPPHVDPAHNKHILGTVLGISIHSES